MTPLRVTSCERRLDNSSLDISFAVHYYSEGEVPCGTNSACIRTVGCSIAEAVAGVYHRHVWYTRMIRRRRRNPSPRARAPLHDGRESRENAPKSAPLMPPEAEHNPRKACRRREVYHFSAVQLATPCVTVLYILLLSAKHPLNTVADGPWKYSTRERLRAPDSRRDVMISSQKTINRYYHYIVSHVTCT